MGCPGAEISRIGEATSLRFAVTAVMFAVSAVVLSCSGGSDSGDTGRPDVQARDAVHMDVVHMDAAHMDAKTSDLAGVDIVKHDLFQTDVDVSGDADAHVDTPDALALGCHPGDGTPPEPDCDHARQVGSISHPICTVVPEGDCHTFWMGAAPNAMYQVPSPNEVPRHKVHLTSYKMSRFPVTVAEYRACVQAGACQSLEGVYCLSEDLSTGFKPVAPNYSDETKSTHPIVCASYSDAQAFCTWLGGELPTEARFEYAGSGPMTHAEQIVMFPWGQNLSCDGRKSDKDVCHVNIKPVENTGDNCNSQSNSDPFVQTSPVGFFNGDLKTRAQGGWTEGPETYQTCSDMGPFGHHDLTHNVMEMVADGPSNYEDWVDGAIDPSMPAMCVGIQTRNTSWFWEEIHHCLVTNRHERCIEPGSLPTEMEYNRDVMRFDDVGFRCAFE